MSERIRCPEVDADGRQCLLAITHQLGHVFEQSNMPLPGVLPPWED